jgi:hypothetical protein
MLARLRILYSCSAQLIDEERGFSAGFLQFMQEQVAPAYTAVILALPKHYCSKQNHQQPAP